MISIFVRKDFVDLREISIVNVFVKLFKNFLFQLIDDYESFFNFVEKLLIILNIDDDYIDDEDIEQ